MTEGNNIMQKIELNFSINELLPFMATVYAKEVAAQIIKATDSLSKGMLKKNKIYSDLYDKLLFGTIKGILNKYKICSEHENGTRLLETIKVILNKYQICSEHENDACLLEEIAGCLTERFESVLKNRFKKEDNITLLFFDNILRLGIDNIEVSTDDFRVLFNVLFLKRLNTSINLNNQICIDFENITFLERIASGIIEHIDMYQIVQMVPKKDGEYRTVTLFCFNKEDLQNPDNLVKKFKFLKKIRKY